MRLKNDSRVFSTPLSSLKNRLRTIRYLRLGRLIERVGQSDRDDRGDAVTAHRDSVQRLGNLHRGTVVRDDDELGPPGEILQKSGEAAGNGLVGGGGDLGQHTKRERIDG